MHSPDSMVFLAAGVCSGVAVFVIVAHWLGVCGEFFGLSFIFVCVGCYVWLPRNSKKIWEVFSFLTLPFKFFFYLKEIYIN